MLDPAKGWGRGEGGGVGPTECQLEYCSRDGSISLPKRKRYDLPGIHEVGGRERVCVCGSGGCVFLSSPTLPIWGLRNHLGCSN